MNDDQQAPEGVEIADYIGEAGSPHPARRSASGGKAADVSSPQRGSRAITVWAVVGLLCQIVAPVLFFNTTALSFFYSLGGTYDRFPFLYELAYYLPVALEAAGIITSITTLLLRRRASDPDLIGTLSLLILVTSGIVILGTAAVFYAFIVSMNGYM